VRKINLVGGGFKHCLSTNGFILPKKIQWVLDGSSDISFHVDDGIFHSVDTTKRNFAFLSESKTIIPDLYSNCLNHIKYLEETYELIFTHDKLFEEKSKKIKVLNLCATSWILEENRKIYPKSKLISMIASTKNMCKDHSLRNQVSESLMSKIDLYGRGRVNELVNKLDGLKDYCFSISMENGTYDNMYSEKILDCFTTGTIPIYHGSEAIKNIFNPEGIIWLKDFNLKNLNYELYESKKEAIKENFEIANSLPHPEDYIYTTFIRQ